MSVSWLAPVWQPGTAVAEVIARPTTGAAVAVAGCRIELMWCTPLPYGVMSWVVTGYVTKGSPVTTASSSPSRSLTLSTQPSLTVGDRARPLWLIIRLPLVVSTESTASISPVTSCRFMVAMSTGESMKGTGSCGAVGAVGQMWVATITSPSSTSPRRRMSSSLAAVASAATAPSASETRPTASGRAPTPPSRPTTPSVRAEPPRVRPARPGIRTSTKSVEPRSPVTVVTSAPEPSGPATESRWAATRLPSTSGSSSRSTRSRTYFNMGSSPDPHRGRC